MKDCYIYTKYVGTSFVSNNLDIAKEKALDEVTIFRGRKLKFVKIKKLIKEIVTLI